MDTFLRVKKAINMKYVIIAVFHLYITLFTDKFIFNDINFYIDKRYIVLKLVFAVLLFFIWQNIGRVIKLSKTQEKYKNLIRFSGIYFIVAMMLLLLSWPGVWCSSDMYYVIKSLKNVELAYSLHYLTSVYYLFAMMLIPFPTGITIVQCMLASLVVGSVVTKVRGYLGNQFAVYGNILYLPFLLGSTLMYLMFVHRPVTYSFLFLYIIIELMDLKITSKEISYGQIVSLSVLIGILSNWRSEGIYLVAAILLICILGLKLRDKKKILLFCCLIVVFFGALNYTQYVNTTKKNPNYFKERYLPSVVNSLQTMFVYDLESDDLSRDLSNINKVVRLEAIDYAEGRHNELYAYSAPNGAIVKSYSNEDLESFYESFWNLVRHNPVYFIEGKLKTFYSASGMDKEIPGNYRAPKYSNLYREYTFMNPINDKLRDVTLRSLNALDRRHNATIIFNITHNFFIPLIGIIAVFIHSIWRRDVFWFLLTGMLLAHTIVVVLTSPTSHFMYYLPIFLSGYVISLTLILKRIVERKLKLG